LLPISTAILMNGLALVRPIEANGGRPPRLFLHDSGLGVGRQEAAGVVAAHAQAGLGEVVDAEAEQLGGQRDFIAVNALRVTPSIMLARRTSDPVPGRSGEGRGGGALAGRDDADRGMRLQSAWRWALAAI
jgi:hypothetical protein